MAKPFDKISLWRAHLEKTCFRTWPQHFKHVPNSNKIVEWNPRVNDKFLKAILTEIFTSYFDLSFYKRFWLKMVQSVNNVAFFQENCGFLCWKVQKIAPKLATPTLSFRMSARDLASWTAWPPSNIDPKGGGAGSKRASNEGGAIGRKIEKWRSKKETRRRDFCSKDFCSNRFRNGAK
jgi:hypothetical protein